MKTENGYTFNVFSPRWAWGHEMLEYDEDGLSVSHIQTDMHYIVENGVFDLALKAVKSCHFM